MEKGGHLGELEGEILHPHFPQSALPGVQLSLPLSPLCAPQPFVFLQCCLRT